MLPPGALRATVRASAGWNSCHNLEEFIAQPRGACL